MPSDLISPAASRGSLNYFALGGSGIRTLEPLLHLCALGLGPRQLAVVLIDPDQSNAAVTRTRELLDIYRRVRTALSRDGAPEDGYFRTEVVDVLEGEVLWSPITDDEHLQDGAFSARLDRALMSGQAENLGLLFDLLFADRVRRMDLNLGFRGVPSIGAVFMNRVRDEPFFEQLLKRSHTDADTVFFSVGSIFGGTGAAALPVIGRALVDGLRNRGNGSDIPGVDARRVGAALLLPYFTLPAGTSEARDGGPRPDAGVFAQNAAAAIPTYTGREARYGSYYVLGDGEPRSQDRNEVGGAQQANRSHYVEFFAALAALDFSSRGGERPEEALPVFRTTAVERSNVRWNDLPLTEPSRQRLLGGFVAAHTFLTVFRPDGQSRTGLEQALRGVTWLEELGIDVDTFQERSSLLDDLGRFFARTWRWAGELGTSHPALEFISQPGDSATALRHDEAIAGRRAVSKLPSATAEGFEVFRHWNVAASRNRGLGYRGILSVMREGSESFAAERFGETINVE